MGPEDGASGRPRPPPTGEARGRREYDPPAVDEVDVDAGDEAVVRKKPGNEMGL